MADNAVSAKTANGRKATLNTPVSSSRGAKRRGKGRPEQFVTPAKAGIQMLDLTGFRLAPE
jgi:hypothetical protein